MGKYCKIGLRNEEKDCTFFVGCIGISLIFSNIEVWVLIIIKHFDFNGEKNDKYIPHFICKKSLFYK